MEDFIASAIRLATPLLLLALGELVAEKAGVLNLGIEGSLLVTALGAAMGAEALGIFGGIALALASGIAFTALLALVMVYAKADQIVVGLAVNLAAAGLTVFVFRSAFGGGQNFDRVRSLDTPFFSDIPYVGLLFSQTSLFYIAPVAAVAIAYLLHRTHWGLQVRAVGDAPAAADADGVPVDRLRTQALLIGGAMTGFAGAYLVLSETGIFTEGMSGGRGFIAIAAVIFGGWRVGGVVIAALIFGGAIALQFELPAQGIEISNQILLALPFIVALAAIAVLPQRDAAPSALMRPFRRGEY